MLVSERVKDEFLPGDRERGDHYFQQNRVRIVDERGDYIAALVDGSEQDSYFVQIDLANVSAGNVSVSCECVRFMEGFLCKHVWATLLDLDQHHHFSQLPGEKSLSVFTEAADSLAPSNSRHGTKKKKRPADSATSPSDWRRQLSQLSEEVHGLARDTVPSTEELMTARKQYWFVLSVADQDYDLPFVVKSYQSTRKKNGDWGKPVARSLGPTERRAISDPLERRIFSLLRPVSQAYAPQNGSYYAPDDEFALIPELIDDLLPALCETGRFVWTLAADRSLDEAFPVSWDDGPPWELELSMSTSESNPDVCQFSGILRRDDISRPLVDVVAATSAGQVLFKTGLSRIRGGHATWIHVLVENGDISCPRDEVDEFIERMTQVPGLPRIEFSEDLDVHSELGQPQGLLKIQSDDHRGPRSLKATAYVRYGNEEISLNADRQCFWNKTTRRIIQRDLERERELLADLAEFPFQAASYYDDAPGELTLSSKLLPQVVMGLSDRGWQVVAHGKQMRSPGEFKFEISSGTDWFDLEAEVHFGQFTASLPTLLQAIREEKSFVVLDDGSRGLLPEEWIARYQRLAHLGDEQQDLLRFSKSQAILLDALLAEQEQVTVDRNFSQLIENVRNFDGITPLGEPEGFQGELREYQRDGLGWMKFLRDFDFAGCLADDMGLGKTVQVLAMLQAQRREPGSPAEVCRPSIVVVPKSLVFNWIDEAARFTPELRVLNYTGIQRQELLNSLSEHDIVVTTYGTLRRDIAEIKTIPFEYAILDESQAIKNSTSQAFKACRLLQAKYRLAMTGTPIENHLGELWSLFEFLNPGMLGSPRTFRQITSKTQDESLAWLGNSLRPFILRRTKKQVLKELPDKTEQTLYCEMSHREARHYKELKEYYRANIGQRVGEVGIKKAKIHVLQALMRLRQAACDSRLLNPQEEAIGSKIELLVSQLTEVLEEGHKALVFSQFTSLLALVRKEIDQQGWNYEYLDGKTRNREECVKRFQGDDDCRLFLISLKAGGHGLNLTAADYVYILDPWWNPAVEAQAIDRAHRIGQTKSVMAYRLITRGTVEEKIVKLQQTKRELADAIVSANEGLISSLSMDDLQLLFG